MKWYWWLAIIIGAVLLGYAFSLMISKKQIGITASSSNDNSMNSSMGQ